MTVIYDPDGLGDCSYNDLVYQGVEDAAVAHGLRTLQPSPSSRSEGLKYLETTINEMVALTDTVRRLLIVAGASYDDYLRQNNHLLEANNRTALLYLDTTKPLEGKGSTIYLPYYGAMYEAGAISHIFTDNVLIIGANPVNEAVAEAVWGFTDGVKSDYVEYLDFHGEATEPLLTYYVAGRRRGRGLRRGRFHSTEVKEVYDGLLFTSHAAAVNMAYPLVSRIREELNNADRKFVFLCGHDSNLASIGAALQLDYPETENALELHTPIGSKLVFEKWSDGSDVYVAINLVYQSVGQLQGCTLLSLDVPPMVLPVSVSGLTANDDGLYRFSDIDARMAETQTEYDAIEDVPTALRSVTVPTASPAATTTIYNLQGQRLDTMQQCVNIVGGEKIIVK